MTRILTLRRTATASTPLTTLSRCTHSRSFQNMMNDLEQLLDALPTICLSDGPKANIFGL